MFPRACLAAGVFLLVACSNSAAPAPVATAPKAAKPSSATRPVDRWPWSPTVNGLQIRAEPGCGLPSDGVYLYDLCLPVIVRNAGPNTLTVPVAAEGGAFHFEYQVDGVWRHGGRHNADTEAAWFRRYGDFYVSWRDLREATGKSEAPPLPLAPPLKLAPGESALVKVVLPQTGGASEASRWRVTLAAGAGDPAHWHGAATTPPANVIPFLGKEERSCIDLPTHMPGVRVGYAPPDRHSADRATPWQFSCEMLERAVPSQVYRDDQVRAWLDGCLRREKVPAMRYALAAAYVRRFGKSEAVRAVVDEGRKGTTYLDVCGTSEIVGSWLSHGVDEWSLATARAMVFDSRTVAEYPYVSIATGETGPTPMSEAFACTATQVYGGLYSAKDPRARQIIVSVVGAGVGLPGSADALLAIGERIPTSVVAAWAIRHPRHFDLFQFLHYAPPPTPAVALDRLRRNHLFGGEIRVLGEAKVRDAVPLLLGHLDKEEAVAALEAIGDPRAIKPLEAIAARPDPRVPDDTSQYDQWRAICRARLALVTLARKDAIPAYAQILSQKRLDGTTEYEVRRRLAESNDPRAVALWLSQVRTGRFGVPQAPWANSREFIEGLIACFDAISLEMPTNPRMSRGMQRRMIAEFLQQVTHQDLPPEPEAWRAWWATAKATWKGP